MRMPNVWWTAWWLGGVLILAGLVLRSWSGDHLFIARYTGYLMPWLLLGLLPGAFWAGLMHYRGLAILLSVSAMIIVMAYVPLFLARSAVSCPADMAIKVISYNTWSKNFAIARIARVIKEQEPDVLLLQEMKPEAFKRLMEHLHDLYPGQEVHFSYEPEMLLAVVSRYPAESNTGIKGKGRVQRVVLRSPAGPIAVFNVHMLRHGGWLSRYRKINRLLEEDVVHEKRPVILGGDFNTPDQSETYKYITRFLDNAHREAGFGFGFSFPTCSVNLFGPVPVPSLVRIDHIFFSNHFSVFKAGTIKDSGGSDHFPVMAVLGLK